MKITFFSFFNFTRPKVSMRILMSEDRELTIEATYLYSDRYTSTLYDLGRTKKEVDSVLNFLKGR